MNRFPGESARRRFLIAATVLSAATLVAQHPHADQIPVGWKASNMKAVGYSDLDGRGGAFKLAIKQVSGHWYLYMGYLWHSGWSIVDVTDPANPKNKFIPGPEHTYTGDMELHGDIMITPLRPVAKNWYWPAGHGDVNKPNEEGIYIWDISDPVNPKRVSQWKTGTPGGNHRDGYPGGKYAYLSASMPGYKGNILVILDIGDPRNPKEAGRWWMPGQKEGEPPQPPPNAGDDAFHGPAYIEGNRAYLGYGGSVVILDISNVSAPKMIGRLQFAPPYKGGMTGVHDVLPIPGKSVLFAHGENTVGDTPASPECSGPPDLMAMVDVKDPTKPRLMATFPRPVPPVGEPYADFCDKGGRFGPHNTNLEYHLPDVQKTENLIHVTYFNAGLRIFNIADPRMPKEVGWFVPPTPTRRLGPIPEGKLVSQTEDVLVDTRGYIYITDKQWGLWVLRYTGPDGPAPTAK